MGIANILRNSDMLLISMHKNWNISMHYTDSRS